MKIKNINIDELTIDINGATKEITYDLLQEINDFNYQIVDIESTDCEGTVQKWVFSDIPNRYVVVIGTTVISDKDNEYHDTVDPDSAFDWK